LWALKSRCRCLTHKAKQVNYLYFGCHVVDAGNSWVPHLRSITCNINLIKWAKGKKNSMPPAVVPMIWRGPISHLENCCLCLTKIERDSKKSTKIERDSKKSKVKIQYPKRSNCKESHGTRRRATYSSDTFLKKSRMNDNLHLLIPAT